MNKQNRLNVTPIVPASLVDQACNLIKEAILNDKYRPNQKLNEVELSDFYGVSRGPIREAFQRLAYEGLVKLVPNKGAFIISFSIKEVEDIYELRENLEIMTVKLAASRANQADLRTVSDLLKASEEIVKKDGFSFYPWDTDFHIQIAKCAKNQALEEYVDKLLTKMRLIRYRSGRRVGRTIEAFKEHEQIYRTICERNVEKAEQLIMDHIQTSKNNILRLLSKKE